MLTDYLGHDLFVGDECVYLRRKRTERNTYITDLEKGVIVEICEDFCCDTGSGWGFGLIIRRIRKEL